MADVLIALGGNVGDVRATFQKAIANICGMTQGALLARSSDYSTQPWGDEQQAAFINACIEIEAGLDPHALLLPCTGSKRSSAAIAAAKGAGVRVPSTSI